MSDLDLVTKNLQEVVTLEELEELLKGSKRRAYIGFEPSGLMHVGQLSCIHKVKDLAEAGFNITVLLADWHAYINDKFDGDIEHIRECGEYIKDCYKAFGADSKKIKFVYATDMINRGEYWEKVIRVAKKTSIHRLRRALTIMGRKEGEEEMDSSKLIYPAMQVTDIFDLEVDVALGGMDQRKAHMLARDAAEKLDWKKPIAIHLPLVSGLKGGEGRMDSIDVKMSKSDPGSSIFLPDDEKSVTDKIMKAFCPIGQTEGNPIVEMSKIVLFDAFGEITIERQKKYGDDLHYAKFKDLKEDFQDQKLHPMDLKKGAAQMLNKYMEEPRKYFEKHPENLEAVRKLMAAKVK